MRAFVCEEIGRVALRDVPEPEIQQPTDVVVRIRATTVCGSDLALVHGHLPTEPGFVIGHEYVGVVEEVGDAVTSVSVGDRVIGPAAPYCGACPMCRADQIQRCQRGGVLGSGKPWGDLGGTMAERLRIPWADRDLVVVPDNLSDEQVLFVGDILSTGWSGIRWARTEPGDAVVVIGAGPVGLSAILVATLHGPRRIVALDPIESRRELASRMGATDVLDPTGVDDVVAEVAALTGGGAETVVEAAGRTDTIEQATRMAKVGGTVSVVGIPGEPVTLDFADLVFRNITLAQGLGYLGDMDRLLALIAAGRIDATPMITHRFTFDEMDRAFAMFASQTDGIVKPFVRVSD